MPTDVIMPQMGESIFEGTITKWLKKPGDAVQQDEPLFEISTDKVDAEIPSPAAGVLSEIKITEGNTVQINTVVGVISDAAGKSAPAQAAAPPAEKKAIEPAPAPSAATPAAPAPPPAAASLTDVIMPQMGESIFEGTITKWLKKTGETVQQDEPLFEISTDKVDAEIPSPAAGVLSEIKVQAGTTVQINTVVATIGVAGGSDCCPSSCCYGAHRTPPQLWTRSQKATPIAATRKAASGFVLRRWSARSPRTITLTCGRSQEPALPAGLPRKIFSASLPRALRPPPKQRPPQQHSLQPLRLPHQPPYPPSPPLLHLLRW